jgi:hypothetical protein
VPAITGFHATRRDVVEALLAQPAAWMPSSNAYDWLGRGIYFWEGDAVRGLQFVSTRKPGTDAEVIGADIELGNCLDLTTQRGVKVLRKAYLELRRLYRTERRKLPVNGGKGRDKPLRWLDCAVVNYAVLAAQEDGAPFDTVRAAFPEGEPIYPGAMLTEHAHIQVAVVNPSAIRAVFRPAERGYAVGVEA